MGGEVEHAPEAQAPQFPGRLLAGRYRLQRVLGEGGMAIVYEGEHVAIGKRVAVKLVQSVFAKDDDIVGRFEREARSASAVESEHIVHVFDVGADPELGLFLVMELLKGEDLARVLATRGRLDPVFACGLVKQAALGLEKAHSAGVVHRDLKPANVFLVERDDGTTLVKLVDFGIAKIVRDAHDARFAKRGITRQGTAVGTPQYMSPEQAQGLETVDHRTDVFSLGAVLFEAIAGQPYLPERPTYEQTIMQLVSTPAPRLSSVVPEIPPALDDLVADMMEHDVARRVQDMRALRQRLEGIYPELHGSRVKLRSLPPASSTSSARHHLPSPTLPATSASIPRARRRNSIIAVAGMAVLLGVGVGFAALGRSGARTDPGQAAGARETAASLAASSPATTAAPAATSGLVATVSASTTALPVLAATPSEGTLPSSLTGPRHAPPPPTTTSAPAPAPRPSTASPQPRPQTQTRDQVGAAGISSQF